MSAPFKLFRLQQIDSQLDRFRARLREIDIALAQDSALRIAQQRFERAEETLQNANRNLRRAEQEVQAQRIKIEQTEASLYGGKIHNPKELQDLQNEAAALKRYLSVLEDRQFDTMVAVEEAETESAAALEELESVQKRMAEKNAGLIDEQDAVRKEVRRQEDERQAAAGNIPTDELKLYEGLRIQRSGVAVARVTDRACAACGSTLSAALLNSARSPTQITRCSTCGRILYAG
jgi:predicted  nucleic acid-binding Zn-ribbon protein